MKLLKVICRDLLDVVKVCEGKMKQTNYLRTLISDLVKGVVSLNAFYLYENMQYFSMLLHTFVLPLSPLSFHMLGLRRQDWSSRCAVCHLLSACNLYGYY